MTAARLIASITANPSTTVRAWKAHDIDPASVSWPEFLVLALQHRVSSLAYDSLKVAGWLDQIPLTIADDLRRRGTAARLRHRSLEAAIAELASREPEVLSRTVLFKGANLYLEYASPEYRIMSDFDVLLSEADHLVLKPHFEALGYWVKESLNGPTYFRGQDGRIGQLCIDVHICGPSKYYRPEAALTEEWLTESYPAECAGTHCKRMNVELQLLNLITHAHEHAASWIHAVLDDDIRLIRALDIELLCSKYPVDESALWKRAVHYDLQGEFALGLWLLSEMRDGLPSALRGLRWLTDLVAELGELYAVPGGGIARWSVPVRDRIFRSDRIRLAFDALPPDAPRHWEHWFDMDKQILIGPREEVERIGELAREKISANGQSRSINLGPLP